MFKQFFINKYFQKLSNTKFFRIDENAIIGKAKDVIKKAIKDMECSKDVSLY